MSTAANKLDSTGYDKSFFALAFGPTHSTLKSTSLSVDELRSGSKLLIASSLTAVDPIDLLVYGKVGFVLNRKFLPKRKSERLPDGCASLDR